MGPEEIRKDRRKRKKRGRVKGGHVVGDVTLWMNSYVDY